MVNGWSIPPLLMASINAYLAVHFLVIYERTRMSMEVLSFALLAFALCFYDVCCAFLYSAPSVGVARIWQLLQTGGLTFGTIGLLVFVAHYTRRRAGRFLAALCIAYSLILATALVGGFDLFFTSVPLVKHLSLPFGLDVTYSEAAAGPLATVHNLVSLSVFLFVFGAGAAQYRSGDRRRAGLLLVAVGALFVAALNDAALEMGLVSSIYLIEYAFMGLVILMADSLSKQLVRVAQIDEALRRSEHNYREVFDATGDAILVNDAATGAILDVNRAMLDLFGYSLEEALRLTMVDLSPRHPPNVEQEIEIRARRAGAEGPQVFDWLARRKNGEEFWAEVALRSSFIGGQGRVLALVRDISERRKATELRNAIYEISEAASQAENLDSLFVSIHSIVGRLMDTRNLYIALHDPTTNLISFPYFVDEVDATPEPFPCGLGMTSYVIRSGRPLLATPGVLSQLEAQGEVLRLGGDSIDWLGVPLRVEDKIIGVMAVQSYTGDVRYTEADQEMLSYVSVQVAQAIERKRAEEQRQRSEQRYRSLVENAQEAILISQDGALQYANPSALRLSGWAESELLGKQFLDFVHPDDREMVLTNFRSRLRGIVVSGSYELRLVRPSGDVMWVENSAVVISWEGKTGLLHFLIDITERKRAEARITQLNRLLRTISEINQLVVRERACDRLLKEACRILVEHGEFRMAWIGFADEASGMVIPEAWAGFEDGYMGSVAIRFDDTPLGRGPIGTAIREGRAVIVNDWDADERVAPWREAARQRGYRSSAACPITFAGRVSGTLSVSAAEPAAFDAEMVALLTELAGDIGFALDAINAAARRETAERALRESELQFRTLSETTTTGIVLHAGEEILYSNAAAARITGFSSEELLTMGFWEPIHPEVREAVRARGVARLAGAADLPAQYETKFLTKAGDVHWVNLTSGVISLRGQPALMVTLYDVTEHHRLREVRAAIYEISEATQTTESLDDLYRAIHTIIGRLMNAKNLYIALYDPTTNLISFPYFVDEVDTTPEPFPCGPGMTSYVIRTGQPLLATPGVLSKLEAQGEVLRLGGDSIDWLGVPLKVEDRIIGVMAVQSYTGGVRYTEADQEMLTYVSAQVAQAIERKHAEEALRESEERFRLSIEEFFDGFALIDEHGRVIEWNAALERIHGIKREEALGMPLWDVMWQAYLPERQTPERYEYLKHSVLDAVQSGVLPSPPSQIEIVSAGGKRRTVSQSVFRVKTHAGFRVGVVIHDLTERIGLEE